jgi:pSer/pThr/pTyr-binding forkhead associated (FHA) protein
VTGPVYELAITSGPATSKKVTIERDLTVGRLGADLSIDDPLLSRRHARFVVRDGRLFVNDLDSTNGTFVNGLRIDDEMRVHGGDTVKLGGTTLQVVEPWQSADTMTGTTVPVLAESESRSTLPLEKPELSTPSRSLARPIGALLAVLLGLGGAFFAFRTSEEGRGPDSVPEVIEEAEDAISTSARVCRKASRLGVDAARQQPRRAWVRDVRKARQVRARTLAVLVTQGEADRSPAFVMAFRRTDSSLLRLERALRPKASRKDLRRARQALRQRTRAEIRAARRADLETCGGIAL